MKTTPFFLAALSLFGALTACTSPSDSGNTTDKSGTVPSVSAASTLALATAECQHRISCDPATYGAAFDSVATCAAYFDANVYQLEAAAPGTGLTADAAALCASAWASADCATDVDRLPACEIKGTRVTGATCTSDRQCVSGNCSGDPNSTGCGVCADAVDLGGSCDNDTCSDGLGCDSTTSKCSRIPTTGESGCASLGCALLTDLCISNTCTTPFAKGEGCAVTSDVGACGLGLYCTKGVCVDIVLAQPGAACGDNVLCADGICSDRVCIANSQAGDWCNPPERNCANGMTCTDGLCTVSATPTPACD